MLLRTGNPINSKCPVTSDFFLPFGGNKEIDFRQSDTVYMCLCVLYADGDLIPLCHILYNLRKNCKKNFSKPIELLFGC